MNQQIVLADKFICDRCKEPDMIESIWKYKELNICTCCANEMRENKKEYNSNLRSMTITDIEQYSGEPTDFWNTIEQVGVQLERDRVDRMFGYAKTNL